MQYRTTAKDAAALPLEPGRLSALVMDHGSMSVRWYAPKGADPQTPHDQDELYIVASGTGTYTVDGASMPFGPGDMLFAAAGQTHRFEDFSDDFATWVVFYGPKGGEKP
jgi:mannose-6-phosphate isomerase-like protein (cupin superfamily)